MKKQQYVAIGLACITLGALFISNTILTNIPPNQTNDDTYTGYDPFAWGIKYSGHTFGNPITEDFNYSQTTRMIIENHYQFEINDLWDVTKGTLYGDFISGQYHRGYIDANPGFRAVWPGYKFYNTTVECRIYKKDNSTSEETYNGVHLFFRYVNPDHLYVASLRNDQKLVIKEKINGVYSTLASKDYPHVINTWYNLRIEALGTNIKLFVNNSLEFEVYDDSINWGTVGIRTDYLTVYLDDFKVY